MAKKSRRNRQKAREIERIAGEIDKSIHTEKSSSLYSTYKKF